MPMKRADVLPLLTEISAKKNEPIFIDASVVPIYNFYASINRFYIQKGVIQIPNCYIIEYAKVDQEVRFNELSFFNESLEGNNTSIWLVPKMTNCAYQARLNEYLEDNFLVKNESEYEGAYRLLTLEKADEP
jgi:hypothetical protein